MSARITEHTAAELVKESGNQSTTQEIGPVWFRIPPKDENFCGSGALPRIPGPENLACDLVWVRPRDRFELLQAAGEAICQIQITELIRCDPV